MRKVLLFVLLLAATLGAATPPIDADRLLGHIRYLASDDLKGRAAGSPELERAADYIAEQFKSFGYEPELQWFEPRGALDGKSANVVARLTGVQVQWSPARSICKIPSGTVACRIMNSSRDGLFRLPAKSRGRLPIPATAIRAAHCSSNRVAATGSRESPRREVVAWTVRRVSVS